MLLHVNKNTYPLIIPIFFLITKKKKKKITLEVLAHHSLGAKNDSMLQKHGVGS